MELELNSSQKPTHLEDLYKDGVVKISSDCIIPIESIPTIIESTNKTPPQANTSNLSVLASQSVLSNTDETATCDMCGDELEMDLLIDKPDVYNDPEHISLVLINDNSPHTNPLMVHQDCLRELGDELQSLLDNNPELVASISI